MACGLKPRRTRGAGSFGSIHCVEDPDKMPSRGTLISARRENLIARPRGCFYPGVSYEICNSSC
jgi:hypothetical protein